MTDRSTAGGFTAARLGRRDAGPAWLDSRLGAFANLYSLDIMRRHDLVIDKVQNVFYRVADLDRAVTFYGDVVGLKMKFRDGEKWAEFDAGNVSLGLELLEGQGSAGAGGGVVVLRGSDLDGLLSRLRAAGYATIGAIDQRPYGRIARFTDPDGNEVNYLEPKPK